MKKPDINQRYKKNLYVVSRNVINKTIIIPLKYHVLGIAPIYVLNDVGAFIWECINGENSLDDIRNMIVEEFEVDQEEAEKDLITFIFHLDKIHAILI